MTTLEAVIHALNKRGWFISALGFYPHPRATDVKPPKPWHWFCECYPASLGDYVSGMSVVYGSGATAVLAVNEACVKIDEAWHITELYQDFRENLERLAEWSEHSLNESTKIDP